MLGEVPTSLSESDKLRLDAACRTKDEGADGGTKDDGDSQSSGDMQNESDARKIAFCVANLAHPHCEGFDPLFDPDEIDFDSSTPWAGGGGGEGDTPDFTEGDPDDRDALLEKLCRDKPEDEKCGGTGDPGGGDDADSGKDDAEDSGTLKEEDDSDLDKDAICALKPTDPHCTGESGKDDGGGDSSGATDDGGSHTGTKDDGGGDSSDTKDDGGGDGGGGRDPTTAAASKADAV